MQYNQINHIFNSQHVNLTNAKSNNMVLTCIITWSYFRHPCHWDKCTIGLIQNMNLSFGTKHDRLMTDFFFIYFPIYNTNICIWYQLSPLSVAVHIWFSTVMERLNVHVCHNSDRTKHTMWWHFIGVCLWYTIYPFVYHRLLCNMCPYNKISIWNHNGHFSFDNLQLKVILFYIHIHSMTSMIDLSCMYVTWINITNVFWITAMLFNQHDIYFYCILMVVIKFITTWVDS